MILLAYTIFLIIFVIYSRLAIEQLDKYGYVGDDCEKMKKAYIIIAIFIIILTLILYFI